MGIDRLTVLLMLALLWTSPVVFFSGTLFRDAKIGVSAFIYFGLFLLLSRIVRIDAKGISKIDCSNSKAFSGVAYYGLALSACLCDLQGLSFMLLLSSIGVLWSIIAKGKEIITVTIASISACISFLLYNFCLGPIIVQKVTGFHASFDYQKFDRSNLTNSWWQHVRDSASLCYDTNSYLFGDLPILTSIPFIILIAISLLLLRTECNTRPFVSKAIPTGLFIVISVLMFALGEVLMYALAIARHPPLIMDDVRRDGYYGLPTTIMALAITMPLYKLVKDQFGVPKAMTRLVLIILLLFNIESMPDHFRTYRSGDMQGYWEATPQLLKELKWLQKQKAPVVISKHYDTILNTSSMERRVMLRNPLVDIYATGSVNADAFIKSSHYVNFLRSKKGLEFNQPEN
jgi:hypothetical protein